MALSFPSSPTLNQEYVYNGIVYTYDGTKWIASVVSNVATMTDLGDVVLTTPSTDQIIQYNGSSWTNVAPEFVSNSGDTMSGILNMGGNLIQNLASPVLGTDATTKTYVDAQVSNAGYTDADVDTHLNTGTATSGELLSWNGTDYDWITAGGGGGGSALELYAENPVTPTAPSATGTNAVAIGRGSVSVGTDAMALGNSYALGTNSFAAAIANNTSSLGALGTSAVAIGYFAKSVGNYSISLGRGRADGTSAVAIGGSQYGNAYAVGTAAVCIGGNYNLSNPTALANGSIALNDGSYSNGVNSIAIQGGNTSIFGQFAYAGGENGATAQTSMYVLKRGTTNATPSVLVT